MRDKNGWTGAPRFLFQPVKGGFRILQELTLFGEIDRVQTAIDRLRMLAPNAEANHPGGLMVCDSGGKDSDVIKELARLAGVRFEIAHSHTTADHPLTVRYVREEQARWRALGVSYTIIYPTFKGKSTSMWALIPIKGAPMRQRRWCCDLLKETAGAGRYTVTGVRWAESANRKQRRATYELPSGKRERIKLNNDNDLKRRMTEFCMKRGKVVTQLFNLLCEKADDVYGGRLPVHVRCLWDECANTGQVPQLEKLCAVVRSREISLCLFLQAQSQLKALYKDNAETIIGNMDSVIFLGGREKTTLKDMVELLGKESIDTYTTSDTRGTQRSYGTNYQKLGRELMTMDELATMPGDKCILQLRGVRPFFSRKYDLTKHPTENQTKGVSGEPPAPYGRYQNIFLSQTEYDELQAEYPDRLERFIEEMSRYLAASGKSYQNYAAALRIWAGNDKKGAPKKGIPDYSCKEGESL